MPHFECLLLQFNCFQNHNYLCYLHQHFLPLCYFSQKITRAKKRRKLNKYSSKNFFPFTFSRNKFTIAKNIPYIKRLCTKDSDKPLLVWGGGHVKAWKKDFEGAGPVLFKKSNLHCLFTEMQQRGSLESHFVLSIEIQSVFDVINYFRGIEAEAPRIVV